MAGLLHSILGYSDVETMLNAHFKGNLISEWDTIFYTDIAPLVFEKIVSRITLSEFSTDFSSDTKYKGGERAMRLNLTGTTSKKRNQLPLELRLAINDPNFKELQELHHFQCRGPDDHLLHRPLQRRAVQRQRQRRSLRRYRALHSGKLRRKAESAKRRRAISSTKLIEHLNSNIEYYNKALWFNLDPDRRYMLLDGFDIQIFNDFGLPIGEAKPRLGREERADHHHRQLTGVSGRRRDTGSASRYIVEQETATAPRSCRCSITISPSRRSNPIALACPPRVSSRKPCRVPAMPARRSRRTACRTGTGSRTPMNRRRFRR